MGRSSKALKRTEPKKPERFRSVPPPWWFLDALRDLGQTEDELAALTRTRSPVALSAHQIGRLRRGEVVTLEGLDALAFALGWPRPVVITESREEAELVEASRPKPVLPLQGDRLNRTSDGDDLSPLGIGAEAQPLRTPSEKHDRGNGYAASNGQADQDPPPQPRKPPRRRRPGQTGPRR